MSIKDNEQLRLARMEAMCNQLRSEMNDVLQGAYQAAVTEQDEQRAADLARKIRNKLLEISDAEFAFDRFGLTLPESISMTNLVSVIKDFFDALRSMLNGNWAVYRQALRDLPSQSGFPFNITWPEIPTVDGATEE